eukprot:INCI6795.2.p1 GENE.INCI6795.2~~INCI6795.2.p1  ORF type:complete len:320 (+),score=60.00 INCI6795.2:257-1216(+)
MASSNFIAVKFVAEGANSLVVPLFTRVDRRAYFASTLDSLYDHFQTQKLEPPLADLDQVWLSYEGKPLAWETPVGVAFDKVCAAARVDEAADPVPLPFAVKVHTSGRPAHVGSCSDERIRSHFMNTLKQASFLRFSSANPVMELSQADQAGLWEGLRDQDMNKVQSCLRSTQLASAQMKFVPVQLFVVEADAQAADEPPIQYRVCRYFNDAESQKSRGVSEAHSAGDSATKATPVTLGDLLNAWVPNHGLFRGNDFQSSPNTRVFTDGICAPFATPLGVLYDELKYHDMYLYICFGQARHLSADEIPSVELTNTAHPSS